MTMFWSIVAIVVVAVVAWGVELFRRDRGVRRRAVSSVGDELLVLQQQADAEWWQLAVEANPAVGEVLRAVQALALAAARGEGLPVEAAVERELVRRAKGGDAAAMRVYAHMLEAAQRNVREFVDVGDGLSVRGATVEAHEGWKRNGSGRVWRRRFAEGVEACGELRVREHLDGCKRCRSDGFGSCTVSTHAVEFARRTA